MKFDPLYTFVLTLSKKRKPLRANPNDDSVEASILCTSAQNKQPPLFTHQLYTQLQASVELYTFLQFRSFLDKHACLTEHTHVPQHPQLHCQVDTATQLEPCGLETSPHHNESPRNKRIIHTIYSTLISRNTILWSYV